MGTGLADTDVPTEVPPGNIVTFSSTTLYASARPLSSPGVTFTDIVAFVPEALLIPFNA